MCPRRAVPELAKPFLSSQGGSGAPKAIFVLAGRFRAWTRMRDKSSLIQVRAADPAPCGLRADPVCKFTNLYKPVPPAALAAVVAQLPSWSGGRAPSSPWQGWRPGVQLRPESEDARVRRTSRSKSNLRSTPIGVQKKNVHIFFGSLREMGRPAGGYGSS